MYIITAWSKISESHVRSPDATHALQAARDLVKQGMRISIVRTSDGEVLAVTELEEEARNQNGA